MTLQSNKALASQLPSTWSVTRQIVRENGLGSRGLNKGLTATIARNGVFNMVYFGFYHSVKGLVPEYEVFILSNLTIGVYATRYPLGASIYFEEFEIQFIQSK